MIQRRLLIMPDCVSLLVGCLILASIRTVFAGRYGGPQGGEVGPTGEKYLPPDCKPCEVQTCPILKFCAGGVVVKDHCGCCPRCHSELFNPHPPVTPVKHKGNVCEQVKCQRFKVCMVNVQGLPLCMCPSAYICRTKRRKHNKADLSVCGTDGRTYETRCHLRIADCNSRRRIKVANKGSCDVTQTLTSLSPLGRGRGSIMEPTRNEDPIDREERIKTLVKATRKRDRRRRKKRRQRRHNKYRKTKNERKYSQLRGKKSQRSRRYFSKRLHTN